MYHFDCPHGCGGEKTLDENRTPWADSLAMARGDKDRAWVLAKWSPEDGYILVGDLSCECPLSDAEFDSLQQQADLSARGL